MTDSTDSKMAKNRPKVQTLAATIGSGIPLADVPRFFTRETTTGNQTGEDSDSYVKGARQAFLEATKKKLTKKLANTVVNECLDSEQSQLWTLYETLRSTDLDDYDAFLANSLSLAERNLGREVTLEELKQV